ADLVDQAIIERLQRIDDIAGCLCRKRGDDDRRKSFNSSGRTFDPRRSAAVQVKEHHVAARQVELVDGRYLAITGVDACRPAADCRWAFVAIDQNAGAK